MNYPKSNSRKMVVLKKDYCIPEFDKTLVTAPENSKIELIG